MKKFITIWSVVLFAIACSGQKNLKINAEFNELEFEFPSTADETFAVQQGNYVRGNAVPIDVDVHYNANGNKRIFVSMPRFTTGIPMTFGTIITGNDGTSKVKAYPSYDMHSSHGTDCNGITSVFRVAIDECNRLWILDTGMIGDTQFCPPQLIVFNLETDQEIQRYRFPDSDYKAGVSLFITPKVDVRDPPPNGRCRNTMVYIADVTGFGIVMYHTESNTSWRAQNKLIYPYPQYGTFTIAGESFDLMDGVLGLSLTPSKKSRHTRQTGHGYGHKRRGGNTGTWWNNFINHNFGHHTANTVSQNRMLYFHALASVAENKVPLSVLDNQQLWENDVEASPRSFEVIGNRTSQSAAQAMDSNGNLFFGLLEPTTLACWNINEPYNGAHIVTVLRDQTKLQFPSGMKVIKNSNNEEVLWLSTCRFQRVMAGTKDSNEVNFRIMSVKISDLLNGQSFCTSRNLVFPTRTHTDHYHPNDYHHPHHHHHHHPGHYVPDRK